MSLSPTVKGLLAGLLAALVFVGGTWAAGKAYYYLRVVWAVEKILVHNERPTRI